MTKSNNEQCTISEEIDDIYCNGFLEISDGTKNTIFNVESHDDAHKELPVLQSFLYELTSHIL